jgi:hypothetical protein
MPNAHTRTKIELSDDERAELMSMARSRSEPPRLSWRLLSVSQTDMVC